MLSECVHGLACAHPFSWVGKLRARVDAAFPGCYLALLLDLASALMAMELGQ